MNEQNENGFTLMETLVTIGITLVLGGMLVLVFSAALGGTGRAFAGIRAATEIARTDRTIRERVGNFHIPHWANPEGYMESLTQDIRRSNIGNFVTSIIPVYDSKKRVRGMAVHYRIGGKEVQTRALFPSTPVLDK
jgi:hypothetical protein